MKHDDEMVMQEYQKIKNELKQNTHNNQDEFMTLINAMKNEITFVRETDKKLQEQFQELEETKKSIEQMLATQKIK